MKTVEVKISNSGKLYFAYDGFQGQECFAVDSQIRNRMAALGLKTDVLHVDEKKAEIATQQIDQSLSTDAG